MANQESLNAVDPQAFRAAMGAFATGVTVVSIAAPAGSAHGGLAITVNSFTSVSLEPPLILWCLGRESERFQAFQDAETFCVSVLAAGQEPLARRFAERGDVPAGDDAFTWGAASTPSVQGAVATFSCRTAARYAGGDHVILVGEVTALTGPSEAPVLGFLRGQFDTRSV